MGGQVYKLLRFLGTFLVMQEKSNFPTNYI